MKANEIEDLQRLLAAHRQTLMILLQQVALIGEAHARPEQISGIVGARAEIKRLKQALRAEQVKVPDWSTDEAPTPNSTGVGLPPQPAISAQERRNRQTLLVNVRASWIKGVLQESLWSKARLTLPLMDRPGAVRSIYDMHEGEPAADRQVPDGTPIRAVYDDAGQSLLILGAPGAGKTTLLLELALSLLDEAESTLVDSSDVPLMPVVFNLASWARGQLPLEAWLRRELNEQYLVSRAQATYWIRTRAILPLLDGLDEVAAEFRSACATAIVRFRHEAGSQLPMVVCCREKEYTTLPKLHLQRAVIAKPLERKEIETVIQKRGAQVAGLQQALERDTGLWELFNTPLILGVAVLAFEGQPELVLPRQGTMAAQRRALFAVYVERMLARKPENNHFPNDVLLARLRWLARQMRDRAQHTFQIEKLQPDWLPTLGLRRIFRWLAVVVIGLISGVAVGLIGIVVTGIIGGMKVVLSLGLILALVFGLPGGIIVGLVAGLSAGLGDVVIVDLLEWQWRRAFSFATLCYVVGFWLAGNFVGAFLFGLNGGSGGARVGLMVGLLMRVFATQTIVDANSTTPNQGIKNSLRSALSVGLGAGLVIGLAVGLLDGLVGGLIGGSVGGLLIGLIYGGNTVIKHYFLRLLLWRSNSLPWRIGALLDAGVERILLQRVGGGWKFVHQLLEEHLAEDDG